MLQPPCAKREPLTKFVPLQRVHAGQILAVVEGRNDDADLIVRIAGGAAGR
jgi:hypothetical protein